MISNAFICFNVIHRVLESLLVFVYVSKYRLLESRLEETVHQTMKIKQEKIHTLENKLEESNKLNTMLRAELATVRI